MQNLFTIFDAGGSYLSQWLIAYDLYMTMYTSLIWPWRQRSVDMAHNVNMFWLPIVLRWQQRFITQSTVKTCVKQPLKNRQNKDVSLMKVESIAEWSILQYFWPTLSDNWSWKPIFKLFESGNFTQVLLYDLGFKVHGQKILKLSVWFATQHSLLKTFFFKFTSHKL